MECADTCHGLVTIEDEWRNDTFRINPSDEDVHSANERRLKVLYTALNLMTRTGMYVLRIVSTFHNEHGPHAPCRS